MVSLSEVKFKVNKVKFKQWEQSRLKKVKTEEAIKFLKECQDTGKVPQFLALYDGELAKKKLNEEIDRQVGMLEVLSSVCNNLFNSFILVLNADEIRMITEFVEKHCVKLRNSIKSKHHKKLARLPLSFKKEISYVVNASSYELTDQELGILNQGLEFALMCDKFDSKDTQVALELLFYEIDKTKLVNSENLSDINLNFTQSFLSYKKRFYKFLSKKTVEQNKKVKELLKKLKMNENIIVTKFDKGKGVAILDKQDYKDKILKYLNESGNFISINEDLIKSSMKEESRINSKIDEAVKAGLIIKEMSSNLQAKGTRPGVVYGLPKVHKPGLPLRPIVSFVQTASYNLANWLASFIKPLANNINTIKDSFSFVQKIKDLKLGQNDVVASLDIENFYPSIPVKEAIQLICDEIYARDNKPKCDIKLFKSLLESVLIDNIVSFDNKLWRQINGVAMGSPLAADVANAYMAILENKSEINKLTKMYHRYVDDTFVVCESEEKFETLFQCMNSLSTSLKITKENMEDNKIGFLDVKVCKMDEHFVTSTYRKKTDTNLMMQYNSNIPLKYKRNLVKNLTLRCLRICSNEVVLKSDLEDLKSRLCTNGFPENFVTKNIEEMKFKFRNDSFTKSEIADVKKKVIFVKLPFLNNASSWFSHKLKNLVESKINFLEIKPVLLVKNKIRDFVSKPNNLPLDLQADLIYQYTCPSCNQSYVGETCRQLHIRACEHLGKSWRTGKSIKCPGNSSIQDHILETGHIGDFSNFKILSKNSNRLNITRKILEAFLIKQIKPKINGNITGFLLNLNFPAW